MFTIDGKIVLQEYDDDWETWLDLMDVHSLKHRQTLCLILSEHAEGKKQVFTNTCLDYMQLQAEHDMKNYSD
jgi:hypothetical protein